VTCRRTKTRRQPALVQQGLTLQHACNSERHLRASLLALSTSSCNFARSTTASLSFSSALAAFCSNRPLTASRCSYSFLLSVTWELAEVEEEGARRLVAGKADEVGTGWRRDCVVDRLAGVRPADGRQRGQGR
jgi:hypothetical protein